MRLARENGSFENSASSLPSCTMRVRRFGIREKRPIPQFFCPKTEETGEDTSMAKVSNAS